MAVEAKHEHGTARLLVKYPQTEWGCSFASLSCQASELESYAKEVEALKEKVKDMLLQPTQELTKKIELINLLFRLGVSYHFKNEIEEQLNHIFIALPKLLDDDNDCDLHTVAILFQILRQYGYKVSCDVFNKFKDDGGFEKTIASDVKGLLSLYEATFLSVHGEDIFDEVVPFTRQHLETLVAQSSPHLANYMRNALKQPFHRSIERVEAKKYIVFYEGEESRDETLLRFAKLDYNRVQLLYRQELASLSRWWKDLDVAEKLHYSRDRIVEAYLWAVGPHFEPQDSLSRMLMAKSIEIITIVDDTYDEYATIDELQRFTAAIERWNIGAIDELPEYMKVLYKLILNFFDEIEKDGYNTCYAKETFKEMVRSNYVQAQWFNDGYIPAFDEYMRNGVVSVGYEAVRAASFIGMENIVGTTELQWLETNPKIVQAAKLISRLKNDIAAREKDGPSTLRCYMNEHGVSREKAIEEFKKMCENAWKDMNEDCLKPTAVSRTLLNYNLNIARSLEFLYLHGDYFTYAVCLKDYVKSLFLEELPL
ncbi:probable terpene synthase 6 [Hevea brasiliensis]|uniref:probable terpene synthase 6 n=1 Tax=Hevea brasiliensis TaxID=3981 RepID=UPI0025D25103|nr:probable terpene synthase 6 [Hevea brasiliensis]